MSSIEEMKRYLSTLSNKQLYDMSFYFEDKVNGYNALLDIISDILVDRDKLNEDFREEYSRYDRWEV